MGDIPYSGELEGTKTYAAETKLDARDSGDEEEDRSMSSDSYSESKIKNRKEDTSGEDGEEVGDHGHTGSRNGHDDVISVVRCIMTI